jgi:hypothetical protein
MRCAARAKNLSQKTKTRRRTTTKRAARVASGISGRVLLGAQDFRTLAFLLLQQVLVEVQQALQTRRLLARTCRPDLGLSRITSC